MVEAKLEDAFRDLLAYKETLVKDFESIENSIRLGQAAAVDEGINRILSRSERMRSLVNNLINEIKYLTVPSSGDKNMLSVLTLLLTVMHIEGRRARKLAEKFRISLESGNENVDSEINLLMGTVNNIRVALDDFRELLSGTVNKNVFKSLLKKYSTYVDKINKAIYAEMTGNIDETLKTYFPENPSAWKRVFMFWKYGDKAQINDYVNEIIERAKKGLIPCEIPLYEIYEMITYERPSLTVSVKDIEKAIEHATKKGIIPGIIKSDKEIVVLCRG